jgi:hypothetical protein
MRLGRIEQMLNHWEFQKKKIENRCRLADWELKNGNTREAGKHIKKAVLMTHELFQQEGKSNVREH